MAEPDDNDAISSLVQEAMRRAVDNHESTTDDGEQTEADNRPAADEADEEAIAGLVRGAMQRAVDRAKEAEQGGPTAAPPSEDG